MNNWNMDLHKTVAKDREQHAQQQALVREAREDQTDVNRNNKQRRNR